MFEWEAKRTVDSSGSREQRNKKKKENNINRKGRYPTLDDKKVFSEVFLAVRAAAK